MKKFFLTTALLTGISAGGAAWVSAQTAPAPKPAKPPAAHTHSGSADTGTGMGTMCGGGMGMGMMGGGMGMMGGAMGPMGMAGADAKVEVKNIDKGVTITLTSSDATRVARIQKMAEAMRLMHEATAP
jgi:hypothetical protein